MICRKWLGKTTLVSLAFAAAPFCYAQQDGLKKALDDTTVSVNFRYRLESVDQDNFTQDALASTLRSRATIQTGSYAGFSSLLEVDNVSQLGNDTYNSGVNGQTQYPVVTDPDGSDLNQALLRYQSATKSTTLDAGRQRINMLNQRFLGAVGWRQNEQTLDGLRVQQQLHNWTLEASQFHNVNRIFGPDGPKADETGKYTNALLGWNANANHTFSVFAHDYRFDHWAARSSLTQGVDYRGSFAPLAGQNLQLHVMYAQQADNSDSLRAFSEDYTRVDALWKRAALALEAGYELLSGDGTSALQTPLATLHAFNGSADIFLSTPVNGLEDVWLGASYSHPHCVMALQYHQYASDINGQNYGDEWNLSLTHNYTKQLSVALKAASYQAEDFAQDTQKIWLSLIYNL